LQAEFRNCISESCRPVQFPAEVQILPKSLNSEGKWTSVKYCQDDELATGFKFEWETDQGLFFDDSGGTGFWLNCGSRALNSNSFIGGRGPSPEKSTTEFCPDGYYLYKIQVQSESDQGTFFDDTTLNNVKLSCKDTRDSTKTVDLGVPSAPQFGKWTDPVECPKYYGIAGLKLQIEDPNGDDTALGAIILYCRPIHKFMNATVV
jgi:hypothetical protein